MMRRPVLASIVALCGVAAALVAGIAPLGACSDSPPATLCKDIPAGGCPLGHGVSCEDPKCVAAYACNGGVWSYDHACPTTDGGAASDAAVEADARPSLVRDAGFPVPPGASGGPGCADLQPPDCSLGTALACPSDQCCDCEDLFVCADAGWALWGSCSDAAIVPH